MPTPPGTSARRHWPSRTRPPALAAYGLEPRHLRPFRTAADREIGLVQQVVPAPHRGKPGQKGKADPTGDVLRLCIALHTALVKDGLGQPETAARPRGTVGE